MLRILPLFFVSCTIGENIKSASTLDVNDFEEEEENEAEENEESSQPESTSQPESNSEPESQPEPASQPTSEPSNQPENTPEPSNQPTSEPSSQPTGDYLYYTSFWSGSWTISGETMSGTENFQYSYFAATPNSLECDMVWNLSGADSSTPSCTNCVFEFEVSASYQNTSIASANCTSLASDITFTYAYSESYTYTDTYGAQQNVGAALLYGDASNSLGMFVAPNNSNTPNVSTYLSVINYDASAGTFSYESGYQNYEYYYGY